MLLHVAAGKNIPEDVNAANLVFHTQNVASATEIEVRPAFKKLVNISFRLNILNTFLKIAKK